MNNDDVKMILRGKVVRGDALGRRSNMPTANMEVRPGMRLPAYGVYASVTRVCGAGADDGVTNGATDGAPNGAADGAPQRYIGLTHIGKRPSVDASGGVTIETHLLDFSGDLYDKTIETELRLYIRGTIKFNNLDEVKAQVDKDILTARGYFARIASD